MQAKGSVASALGYTEKGVTESANSAEANARDVHAGVKGKVNEAASYVEKETK